MTVTRPLVEFADGTGGWVLPNGEKFSFAPRSFPASLLKPRLRPVGHTPGWWECNGEGRRSIGRTPAAAYRSWRAAAQWGGA